MYGFITFLLLIILKVSFSCYIPCDYSNTQNLDNSSLWILNNVSLNYSNMIISAQLETLQHNEWIIVWSNIGPNSTETKLDNEILFIKSKNGGKTWSQIKIINSNSKNDLFYDNEPVISFDKINEILVVFWYSTSFPTLYYSISLNKGENWTKEIRFNPSNDNFITKYQNTNMVLSSNNNGSWMLLWNLFDTKYYLYYSIGELTKNNTIIWSNYSSINNNPNPNIFYSKQQVIYNTKYKSWIACWIESDTSNKVYFYGNIKDNVYKNDLICSIYKEEDTKWTNFYLINPGFSFLDYPLRKLFAPINLFIDDENSNILITLKQRLYYNDSYATDYIKTYSFINLTNGILSFMDLQKNEDIIQHSLFGEFYSSICLENAINWGFTYSSLPSNYSMESSFIYSTNIKKDDENNVLLFWSNTQDNHIYSLFREKIDKNSSCIYNKTITPTTTPTPTTYPIGIITPKEINSPKVIISPKSQPTSIPIDTPPELPSKKESSTTNGSKKEKYYQQLHFFVLLISFYFN